MANLEENKLSPGVILGFLNEFGGGSTAEIRRLAQEQEIAPLSVEKHFGYLVEDVVLHFNNTVSSQNLSFDKNGKGQNRSTSRWYPQSMIASYFWSSIFKNEFALMPIRLSIFAERIAIDGEVKKQFRAALELDRARLKELASADRRTFISSYYEVMEKCIPQDTVLLLGANEKSGGERNGRHLPSEFEVVSKESLRNSFGDRPNSNKGGLLSKPGVLSGNKRIQPSIMSPELSSDQAFIEWGEGALRQLFPIYEKICSVLTNRVNEVFSGTDGHLLMVDAAGGSHQTAIDLNTILYGPPGTGKTYRSAMLGVRVVLGDDEFLRNRFFENDNLRSLFEVYAEFSSGSGDGSSGSQIEFLTFHQSYSYEDFIEGIRPVVDNASGQIRYEYHDGIFKRLCKRALENPDRNYVLIIDEINRGNLSKIFGELITLLEKSKRVGEPEAKQVTLPYSGEKFEVPTNLYLIGTMNSADRSVAAFDTAFRRRFVFEELMPDYEVLPETVPGTSIDLRLMLRQLNDYIELILDRDHVIGHAYLMGLESMDDLQKAFKNKIFPLLQEYFFDDYEKIRFVLGDNYKSDELAFVVEESTDFSSDNQFGFSSVRYRVNADAFANEESYKQIYAPRS